MLCLSQHSDLSDAERHAVLEKFQRAVVDWNQSLQENTERIINDLQEAHSHLLVVTDACLPSQALSEAPLCARVLINYDLPGKKVILIYSLWMPCDDKTYNLILLSLKDVANVVILQS